MKRIERQSVGLRRMMWGLTGVVVALWGFGVTGSQVLAERLTMVIPSRGLYELPVQLALELGLYRQEGIDLIKPQMHPVLALKAVIGGNVDYALLWGTTVRGAVTGAPVRAVANLCGRPLHMLIGGKGVNTGKDLKGKTLGMDGFGGTVDYLTREVVRHFGMDPDRDVTIIMTGESPTRFAALKSGAIDATVLDMAFAVQAEQQGFRNIIYLGDVLESPITGIGTTLQRIATKGDEITRVVRASLRGVLAMKNQREETIRVMGTYLGLERNLATKVYDQTIKSFNETGELPDRVVQVDIDLVRGRVKMTREVPVNQVVDWRFARAARASLR